MTQRPEDLLSELARTATNLGAALTPAGHHELLRSITAAAKDLFGAAACSLALLDEEQENLVFHVATGAGADEVVGVRVPVGRGVAGWVVTSGQPIAIADVRRDPRFASDVAQTTGYVPQSILAMPLQTERSMLGVIEVLDRSSDGREDRRDMQLLGLFAEQAALAIENSRVFSELGRVLLDAAADAAGDGDLGEALRRAAREAPAPEAELAELGAVFNELGRAGPDARGLAVRIVGEILAFQRARERKWTS